MAQRSFIQSQSNFAKCSKVSLQCCTISENELLLAKRIELIKSSWSKPLSTENEVHLWNLQGIRAVWQMLIAEAEVNGISARNSFSYFDEALELFLSFNLRATKHSLSDRETRKRLKDLLCHPKYGPCVYIVMDGFILLKSDEVNMSRFFDKLVSYILSEEKQARQELDRSFVNNLLASADSEWDRTNFRFLLGVSRTKRELEELGIGSDIGKYTREVVRGLEQISDVKNKAKDEVKASLQAKIEVIDKNVNELKRKLLLKRNK